MKTENCNRKLRMNRRYFISVTASSEEYCQWENFNATCGHNEVILITSAYYGRMRVGRCVPYDYYVGCSTNVFDHLATRCSARQRCVVPIPAPELFKVHPCRKDLVAYMDASYQCVAGLLNMSSAQRVTSQYARSRNI